MNHTEKHSGKTTHDAYANSKVNVFQFALDGNTQRLLPRSQNRLALHLYAIDQDFFVYFGDEQSTQFRISKVAVSGFPFTISLETHGDMATGGWGVKGAAGAGTIGVVEVLSNCPCGTGH